MNLNVGGSVGTVGAIIPTVFKIPMVAFCLVFQWCSIFQCCSVLNKMVAICLKPLDFRTKWMPVCPKPLEIPAKWPHFVRFSNGLVLEWLGPQLIYLIQIQKVKKNFKVSEFPIFQMKNRNRKSIYLMTENQVRFNP